jgi:hypothetical protein
MALSDRVYDEEGLTPAHITCAENARIGCHHTLVGLDPDWIPSVYAAIGRQEGEIRPLADCPDNQIGRQDMLRAGDLLDIRTTMGKSMEMDLDASHPDDMVTLDNDLFERSSRANLDTFNFRNSDFPGEPGHFSPRFQASNADRLGSQAQHGSGGVKGHVAAPQDRYFLPPQIDAFT